jgi:hypothetical protein
MDIRKLPAGQGVAWFRQAVNLGARNPKAVFGAALLFILSVYALAFVLMLPAMEFMGPATPAATMIVRMVPSFLAILVVLPVLFAGLMHVIREAEAGRPARARDLYAPFRDARARRLAALGLVQLLFATIGAIVVVPLTGSAYWHDYFVAMQAAMGGSVPLVPEPAHPVLLLLFQLLFNYVTYAVVLFSVPLILFSGQGLLEAIGNSLRAAAKNVLPNLVAGLVFLAAVVVAGLAMMLLGLLASLIGGVVSSVVGALLAVVIVLCFGVAVMVVLTGTAYFAWRDTFGVPPETPAAFAGIEA